jgi:hypothetical protein
MTDTIFGQRCHHCSSSAGLSLPAPGGMLQLTRVRLPGVHSVRVNADQRPCRMILLTQLAPMTTANRLAMTPQPACDPDSVQLPRPAAQGTAGAHDAHIETMT